SSEPAPLRQAPSPLVRATPSPSASRRSAGTQSRRSAAGATTSTRPPRLSSCSASVSATYVLPSPTLSATTTPRRAARIRLARRTASRWTSASSKPGRATPSPAGGSAGGGPKRASSSRSATSMGDATCHRARRRAARSRLAAIVSRRAGGRGPPLHPAALPDHRLGRPHFGERPRDGVADDGQHVVAAGPQLLEAAGGPAGRGAVREDARKQRSGNG